MDILTQEKPKPVNPELPNAAVHGLTSKEVKQRIQAGQVNVQPDASAKSAKDIVKENVCTYFNAIFLLLAILLIIAEAWNSLTFLPVIIANTCIGIAQELYAKKVLDQLSVLSQATCTVLRDGTETNIPVTELVLGDVIHLEAGQQIPADGVLIAGKVMVNESLLTGEQDEIEKTIYRGNNELKSGSFTVSGDCYAMMTRVGADSYVSKLTAKAKVMKQKQSEMIHDIDLIVKTAGVLIIPIGIVLFAQGMRAEGSTYASSVTSMVAAVTGMIPEGLYLLVTVALALSAVRLAQSKIVLHDMRSIETLARTDILCVDKTGTITSNEMSVTDFFLPKGCEPDQLAQASSLLAKYVNTVPDNNITMIALRARFASAEKLSATEVKPFSSKTKYSEIVTAEGTYRLGAPEYLLDARAQEDNWALINSYAGKGERVMAFVMLEGGSSKPLALISLKNGIRAGVKETFTYFRHQGVAVKVISGDNPLTVSRIAQSVGIPQADRYIDATQLNSKEEIEAAVRKYTVFGRVRPEQKKQIVQAYKAMGKTVAMTGDGVNDILAMKEADCSIAIGSGSQAAMQAAQVVLLDSDFNHMQAIVSEGRRDINNISRSATLFLVKNIFSLLLAIFSIVNMLSYPLKPSQISLISMFNIGIPAFFLALEPNDHRQEPHFLKHVLSKAMPAALTDFFAIAALVIFGQVFEVSSSDISVAATFLLAIVGFIILINISQPMNKYHLSVILGCIAAMFVTAYFFNDLFSITRVSPQCIMLFVVFALAEECVMRYLTMLSDRLGALNARRKAAALEKEQKN
ncbi:MAG: HAD-IC family P-type ATPase [Solobacterium sp.]|jgi:cation-transporting ATPase E|nr:HAD-IC family P-type ATPase [Solobacterium sp.]MCH4223244.1 HAD-IC family P-type ATPase [Solobacterium sp.]MCH4266061.1 HAD-IC family P-type ATPase [Solobacterium sp.]